MFDLIQLILFKTASLGALAFVLQEFLQSLLTPKSTATREKIKL
jgi:hypothetical protein